MNTSTATTVQLRPTSRPAGAKTPHGQASDGRRSNALKHGLSAATDVLLPDEDPREYEELLERLNAELCPVGVIEGKLVARLGNAFIRLQRAERFERSVLVSEGCSEATVGIGLAFMRTCMKGDTLGKALRHAVAAERSVWSILAHLDRLRAARQGQVVPVPEVMNININAADPGDSPDED